MFELVIVVETWKRNIVERNRENRKPPQNGMIMNTWISNHAWPLEVFWIRNLLLTRLIYKLFRFVSNAAFVNWYCPILSINIVALGKLASQVQRSSNHVDFIDAIINGISQPLKQKLIFSAYYVTLSRFRTISSCLKIRINNLYLHKRWLHD